MNKRVIMMMVMMMRPRQVKKYYLRPQGFKHVFFHFCMLKERFMLTDQFLVGIVENLSLHSKLSSVQICPFFGE